MSKALSGVLAFCAILIAGSVFYYYVIYLPQEQTGANIFQSLVNSFNKPQVSQVTPAPPAQQTPTPTHAPTQVLLTKEELNQPFVVDDVQYTVSGGKNLGNQLAAYTTPSQGSYIQVKFSGENVGTQSVSVHPTVYLQDSMNRQFQTASVFMYEPPQGYTIYNSSYGTAEFGTYMSPIQLQPGFSQKLVSIFEVPATSSGLILVVANGSTENYYVPLGF
jgi:hypothetical protein